MTTARLERGAWGIGGLGLIACAAVWRHAPALFPHAWLAALTCWLEWPLGSLALIFIHALTGGRWGLAIRTPLASGVATLPLLLPALLPLMIVLPALYPWLHADVAAGLDNRFYLNASFFYARLAVYLSVWLGLGFAVQRALRLPDPQPRLERLAPAGLILLALTVTFSAIDFTLSLDPHFQSSIYGILAAGEALLLALSVAVAALTFAPRLHLAPRPHPAQAAAPVPSATAPPGTTQDLARLLLALVALWAYLDFMQLLIVWNSNLPDEAHWYLPRYSGSWAAVAILVAALHFLLPFLALIWPPVQRSEKALGALATLLVVTAIPRAWWLVIPAARSLSVTDAAPMLALIGLGAAMALRSRRSSRYRAMGAAHG